MPSNAALLGPLTAAAGPMGPILSGLGGLLGFFQNNREFEQLRGDITGMTEFNPSNFFGPGAFVNSHTGSVALDPFQQAIQQSLGGSIPGLFGGGSLFNDANIQGALQATNLPGAVNQATQALSTQASPFFNQGGFNQVGQNISGLGNLFAASTAAGPQDFSGGAMASLLGGGLGNIAQAGDQTNLFNQALGNFRAAAQPATDRLINRLQDRLFAQGRLGSTGGAQETEALTNALFQQDLGFQQAARGEALNQQQFLAGLGQGQIGLGQGFLGQNLNQFNTGINAAAQFAGLGQAQEGQGFAQGLQALGQNQTAGLNRLNAMSGLFGLGNQLQQTGFNQGLAGSGLLLDQAAFGRDTLINLLNAEANRIGATGLHAQALGNIGTSGSGGFLSGALDAIGGLFG